MARKSSELLLDGIQFELAVITVFILSHAISYHSLVKKGTMMNTQSPVPMPKQGGPSPPLKKTGILGRFVNRKFVFNPRQYIIP